MFTGLYIALLIVALATVGRLTTPRHERLPVLGWSVRDVAANAVRGARVLLTCSDRVQTLLPGLRPPGRHGNA